MLVLAEEEIAQTETKLKELGSAASETGTEDDRLKLLREIQARIALALKKYAPPSP
jgi:hypothetical protein